MGQISIVLVAIIRDVEAPQTLPVLERSGLALGTWHWFADYRNEFAPTRTVSQMSSGDPPPNF
jgi:hypothetical protein